MNRFVDKVASLIPAVRRIMCQGATEYPHTGAYNSGFADGSYLCRRCGLALLRANNQFNAGCGWPSFDGSIAGVIQELPDKDGQRVEIRCHRCSGHLGHVFDGEHLTLKNRRFCINAASLDFVDDNDVMDTEEAILAGGCFWGVDYYLSRIPGVLQVEAGYIGGETCSPTYEQVCMGNSGHFEAIRVVYDVAKTDYHTVLKRFFEIHDPTQANGQGPDLGSQYRSGIFYYNQSQYTEANTLIQQLTKNGYDVVTHLLEMQPFWPAEAYHQHYYAKHQTTPYCHQPVARFE